MKIVTKSGFWCLILPVILMVLAPIQASMAQELRLSIQDVISASLEHNLDLQIERLSPQIGGNDVEAEESVFDPVFTAESSGSNRNVDEEDATTTDVTGYTLAGSASKKFGPGTEVALSLEYLEDQIDSASGDGTGTSGLASLIISQPLLKNRGTEVNRKDVTLATDELSIANLNLKQAIIDTVTQAQELYWQYYFSLAYLDVQRQSLTLAKESLEEMEEKIRLGSSPRLDLLRSQSEVASREETVIVAENDVHNSRDELLNYIYGSLSGEQEVVCSEQPTFVEVQLTERSLIDYALESRTEYKTQQIQLQSAETERNYFDNQRLPQLDFSGTLSANDGDAGGGAITQMQSDEYQDYTYGMVKLSLEFPFGFRRDNANYGSAVLRQRQAVLEKERIKSQVILEVRSALRDLESARKRYMAARLASKYAKESLKTEQEKFANGLSTSYQVLLYQRDLADAQSTEVEATVGYQTAMIQLQKTTGATLEKNNIIIDGENT